MAEIEFFHKVIFLLFQKVLSRIVSFWFFFVLGYQGFQLIRAFILLLFLNWKFLPLLVEELKKNLLRLLFFDLWTFLEHREIVFHFLVIFDEDRVLFLELFFDVTNILSTLYLDLIKLILTLFCHFFFLNPQIDVLVVKQHYLTLIFLLFFSNESFCFFLNLSEFLVAQFLLFLHSIDFT